MKNVLLSICIPTYNRGWCIKQQIENLSKCSSRLLDKLEILISDNCSTDNTQEIVEDAMKNGFSCTYIRNEVNLGMDGNFTSCFKKARGKYVWLIGDDDLVYPEAIARIVEELSKEKEFGLIHIDMNINEDNVPFLYSSNKDDFLRHISYWITFLSGNIVNSKYVSRIDFDKYRGSFFSQIPVYLTALGNEEENLIINFKTFDFAKDAENNGGYNIFNVFVKNYLWIMEEGAMKKFYNRSTFAYLKKDILLRFLDGYISKFLFNKDSNHKFNVEGAWKVLFENYGTEPYFYLLLIKKSIKYLLKR